MLGQRRKTSKLGKQTHRYVLTMKQHWHSPYLETHLTNGEIMKLTTSNIDIIISTISIFDSITLLCMLYNAYKLG